MAKTTNDIVTYPALNGALTKVKNKLQEQISNAAGGTTVTTKMHINAYYDKLGARVLTAMTKAEFEEALKADKVSFYLSESYSTGVPSPSSRAIGLVVSRTSYSISILVPPEVYGKFLFIKVANGAFLDTTVYSWEDMSDVDFQLGNNTSVKASDGLIKLTQGNASLTMQDNAIAADLGSNTSVNAKAGEVTLKQGDAMVQLKSEGILLKQDLSRVQVAGNEIHAVIWEGEASEVYLRIAPDGIWIRSGLVQEGQMRRLRLDKLLSSGFFDW